MSIITILETVAQVIARHRAQEKEEQDDHNHMCGRVEDGRVLTVCGPVYDTLTERFGFAEVESVSQTKVRRPDR